MLFHRAIGDERDEGKKHLLFSFDFAVNILQIVSDDSARLKDRPSHTLYADHKGMCKFTGEDDSNYKRVLGVLERWMDELRKELAENKKTEKVSPVNCVSRRTQMMTDKSQSLRPLRAHPPSQGVTTVASKGGRSTTLVD